MSGIQGRKTVGDDPIRSVDEDKLGFASTAKHIALSLADSGLADGFVVGVNGKWGSGKTSLMELVKHEIKGIVDANSNDDGDLGLTVVDFNPWLVGDRNALIQEIFAELAGHLESLKGIYPDKNKKIVQAIDCLVNYGDRFLPIVFAAFENPEATALLQDDMGNIQLTWKAFKFIKKSRELFKKRKNSVSLPTRKRELVRSLKELNHRFIVVIDDIDRLDPDERIEILRLVRSVLDLPNVVYVLVYDEESIAESIASKFGCDGREYLGKIVQYDMRMPLPNKTNVVNWMLREMEKIYDRKDGINFKMKMEFAAVVCGFLEEAFFTPRSVKKALNAIRFNWPHVREGGGNFYDLAFIEVVKMVDPEMYDWIQRYCQWVHDISIFNTDPGDVHQGERSTSQRFQDEVCMIAKKRVRFKLLTHANHFAEFLVGIECASDIESSPFRVPSSVDITQNMIKEQEAHGRLSSPSHYHLYFHNTPTKY